MDLDPTSSTGAAAASQDSKTKGAHPRFHRLTWAELQEKRQNGRCYFCPKPYSKGRKCAMKGVFLMELAEGEEGPLGDISNLEISLCALIDLRPVDSMLL